MLYAGVLQGLVPLLWGPGAYVQYHAAQAMLNIARNESSFDAITTAGAIKPLAALLHCQDSDTAAAAAAEIIQLMAGNVQHKDAIMAAGVMPLLKQLLGSTKPGLQKAAADAIQRLESPSLRPVGGATQLTVSKMRQETVVTAVPQGTRTSSLPAWQKYGWRRLSPQTLGNRKVLFSCLCACAVLVLALVVY